MVYAAIEIKDKFAPAKIENIGQIVNLALPIMMTGGAIIFLVMALYGAFLFLTNGANPEGLKKARSTIIFAVIGLIIVVVSFVAVQILGKLLGVELFI